MPLPAPFSLPVLMRGSFVLAVAAIFVLAMIPVAVVPEVVSFQDKLHHTAAFAVLMLLGRGGWPARTATLIVGLIGYGVLIEVCQHFFTLNRVGEFQDVLADSLGVACGWLLSRPRQPLPS
ncbi:VanZ family protein [Zoogloea sp.]|uniref:VanZ family protein n=1 Tax=Zoogloea sp. TaxID=49181 RepID=UPI00321FF299